MIGKIGRFIAWILFAPFGAFLTWRKSRKKRRELEAQRHAEVIEATRNRNND